MAGSGARTGTDSRTKLTILEVCAERHISRLTFYDWRAKGKAPRCIKLPNAEIRIRRTELDRWSNGGVDATQVADWAGRSVANLLRIYVRCVDGREQADLQRIDAALS